MSNYPELPAAAAPARSDGFMQIVVLFVGVAALLLVLMSGTPSGSAHSMADKTVDGTVQVYFSQPQDGATVAQTFTVVMTAEGVQVDPAGEIMEGSGHFHILINEDFVTPGEIIPIDTENYLHFGQAQAEAELTLPPGEYTLRLQLADGAHRAYDSAAYGDTLQITVE